MNKFAKKAMSFYKIKVGIHVKDSRDLGLVVFNQETFERFVKKVESRGINLIHQIMIEMKEENDKKYWQYAVLTYKDENGVKVVYGKAADIDKFAKTLGKLEFFSVYYKHTENEMLKRAGKEGLPLNMQLKLAV